MSESFHDNCGVACVVDLAEEQDVVPIAVKIAEGLQHRGDLGAGLSWIRKNPQEGQRIGTIKGAGLVGEVLTPQAIAEAQAQAFFAITHTRYATNGSLNTCYFQPFQYPHEDPCQDFAMAFNGNLPDCAEQLAYLRTLGVHPALEGDTEVIGQTLVAGLQERASRGMRQVLQKSLGRLDGAFNPIVMTADRNIFAVRDRHGFHPLVYGRQGSLVAVASEDSAILRQWPHAEIHDIPPGHVLRIDGPNKNVRERELWTAEPQICFFESIYFANHTSHIDGTSVANARYECGKILAERDAAWIFDQKAKNDPHRYPIVVPVPESAKIAANGYADTHGLRRVDVIAKNPKVGRTFTSNGDRAAKAMAKYDIDPDLVRGRSIVLMDDSMVRGTTMRVLVQQLRHHGAGEIHLRLASPPILAPCFYGLDFPTVTELIARKYSNGVLQPDGTLPDDILQSIAQDLGVDSVRFLPATALPRALEKKPYQICTSCVTGKYPTDAGNRLYGIENAKAPVV